MWQNSGEGSRDLKVFFFFLVPVLSTPIRPTSPLQWVDEASVFLPTGEEIWSFAIHSIAVKESAISLCDCQLQNQYPHSNARATSLQDCQFQNCFQEFTDIRILYCPCFPFHKGNWIFLVLAELTSQRSISHSSLPTGTGRSNTETPWALCCCQSVAKN